MYDSLASSGQKTRPDKDTPLRSWPPPPPPPPRPPSIHQPRRSQMAVVCITIHILVEIRLATNSARCEALTRRPMQRCVVYRVLYSDEKEMKIYRFRQLEDSIPDVNLPIFSPSSNCLAGGGPNTTTATTKDFVVRKKWKTWLAVFHINPIISAPGDMLSTSVTNSIPDPSVRYKLNLVSYRITTSLIRHSPGNRLSNWIMFVLGPQRKTRVASSDPGGWLGLVTTPLNACRQGNVCQWRAETLVLNASSFSSGTIFCQLVLCLSQSVCTYPIQTPETPVSGSWGGGGGGGGAPPPPPQKKKKKDLR